MASFKIHEDKENHYIHQPKKILGVKVNNVQDKKINGDRKVLGYISNITKNGDNKYTSKDNGDIKNTRAVRNRKYETDVSSLDKECCYIPKAQNVQPQDIIRDTCNTLSNKQNYDHKLDIYTRNLYRKDIYRYLLLSERKHRPNKLYMNKQPELNDGMRCILIDWLVSISDEYSFSPATLHLAVSYLDRFLSKMAVVRTKLQLVGVAAIMIAAKYEEIYPPDSAEFAYLTNGTYTVKQILKMEQLMLRTLSFDLTVPTVQTFIEEYASQGDISKQTVYMAMYLSELCMVESVDFVQYLPSEIAASSLALASHTLHNTVYPKRFNDIWEYSLPELLPIINKQNRLVKEAPNKSLQAVRIKYNKESIGFVADIPPRRLENMTKSNDTFTYTMLTIIY